MTPVSYGWNFFPQLHYERLRRYAPDSAFKARRQALRAEIAKRDSVAPALPRRPRSLADWKAVSASGLSPIKASSWTRDSAGAPPLQWNYHDTPELPIVAGTDAAMGFGNNAGFGLHEALVSFVLGGMTPLEALQTATLNPALALHATDSLGIVAPGKLADLMPTRSKISGTPPRFAPWWPTAATSIDVHSMRC